MPPQKPIAVRIVESGTPFKVAIVILALCYLAADILIPLVIAVLLSFLLQPLVDFLDRRHVPHTVSCALALILATGLILLVIGYSYLQLAGASVQIGRWVSKLQSAHEYIIQWVEWLEPDPALPREQIFYLKPEFWTSMTMSILSRVTLFLASALLIIFVAFFLLRDGKALTARLLMASGSHRANTRDILDNINIRIRKYVGVVFLIEAALATLIGAVLWIAGVPYAFLWALTSAVLGMIPFVGATLAAIPPLLVTLAEYDGYTRPLIVLGIYVMLQVLDGKFITPLLVGRRVNLSPLVILLSTLFWGWIWGLPGLLLATPLLVCIKVVAENIPSLHPLSLLLSGSEDVTPLQPAAARNAESTASRRLQAQTPEAPPPHAPHPAKA